MNLAAISEILETYEGRDKFLKTLSYAAKLATLFAKTPESLEKCKLFGSQMSGCRVILRLMDDIPILHETVTYGWGRQETDGTMRWLNVFRNAVDLIASPIEHICWFGEQRLIKTNEDFWDKISTRLWVIYLYVSLMISLRKLGGLHTRIETISLDHKQSDCSGDEIRLKRKLRTQQQNQLLTILRLGLDLSYAISYLPPGNLWGGYLKSWQIGALGTLSSVIGLYQVFRNRQPQQEAPPSTASSCVCNCNLGKDSECD